MSDPSASAPQPLPPWQRTFLPEPAPPATTAAPAAPWPTPSAPTHGSTLPLPPGYAPSSPTFAAGGYANPPAVSRFGGPVVPPGGGWGSASAAPVPRSAPSRTVYAGRWARARGVLGLLVTGGSLVVLYLAASSPRRAPVRVIGGTSTAVGPSASTVDDSTVVLVMLLCVAVFGLYLFWLVAGHRTIHGSRGAASWVLALSVVDLVLSALLLAFGVASAGSVVIGTLLTVTIIVLLLDKESVAWRRGG